MQFTKRLGMRQKLRAFTLIEVLLALGALALLSAISWQSIDALLRAQARNEQASQRMHLLHGTLQQWEADLNSVAETQVVSAIDFDGKRMRLTRRDPREPGKGVRVVAWSIENRNGQDSLVRWQSPMLASRAELERAWQQATQSGSARPGEIQTAATSSWQIYYFRGNAWVNPLSASEQAQAQALAQQAASIADAARRAAVGIAAIGAASAPLASPPNPNVALMPDGVRLQISVPASAALGGQITKDWIQPRWTPGT